MDCVNKVAEKLKALGFVARVEEATEAVGPTRLDYFLRNTDDEARKLQTTIEGVLGFALPLKKEKRSNTKNFYGLWINECR